jgi:hypothetical protein
MAVPTLRRNKPVPPSSLGASFSSAILYYIKIHTQINKKYIYIYKKKYKRGRLPAKHEIISNSMYIYNAHIIIKKEEGYTKKTLNPF